MGATAVHMKSLLTILLVATLNVVAALPSRASVKRGDVVYHCRFSDRGAQAGWQGLANPSIGWSAMPPSSKALHIANPVDGSHNAAASIELDVAKLRGLRLVVSAKVKATDVVKPAHSYNGIKVMLVVKKPGGDQNDQMLDVHGTFDWREIRFGSEVPDNATAVTLVLGIENTSGTADFDDVRVTVLEAPRNPNAKPIPGLAYTGHTAPRLRGAMVSPSIVEADASKLAKTWNANVVRFQLTGSRGGEADLGPAYDTWLDTQLAKLDRFLPIAKKNGILILIDMHSAPGGRISSYVGDRIFDDVRYQDKLAQAWVKISKRYKGNSTVWGYDLCNEPLERTTRDNVPGWEALATRLAKIVRRNDPDHAIIVESMNADASEFRYLSPIPVKGIVYSAHFYAPYTYTMQGVSGAWKPVQYPGSIDGATWDKAKIAETLQPIVDFQKQCHAAIFIGEFSAVRWAPNSMQWLHDAIDIFEANQWDWAYHAFREWPGWDAEYPADHDANAPSATPTERETLLKSYYARNDAQVKGKQL